MSSQAEHKGVIGIIKSGLAGAFTLTGISLISVIVFARSQTFSSLVEAIFKIIPSILGLFIIIGGIGFILGLVLRRHFPTIQTGIWPLVLANVMLALPIGFIARMVHTVSMNMEYPPLSLKLADCTNNVLNIHLKIPAGRAYQLELKGPGIQFSKGGEWRSSYNFSGHVRISSNGALLLDIPIGSDKAWLTGSGYVLTGAGMENTNVPPLSKFIQSYKSYDFEISLEPTPPPSSSVWLYWREAKIDN